VFRLGGPTIAASMLWPLLIMALGYMAYFLTVLILALRAEIAERRLRVLRLGAAREEAAAPAAASLGRGA